MKTLIKLATEFRKSDTRISQIERRCYNGDITSEEACELVERETKRIREKTKRILFDPVKEYGYMGRDVL